MINKEIQERNEQIALMLGWKNSFAHKVDQYGYYQTVDGYSTPYRNTLDEQAVEYQIDKNAFAVEDLQFHSDWNWLINASKLICDTIGYKMYFVSTPSYSRCIFTDTSSIDTGMMPLDKTEFITGKIVVDSDIQKTDIRAVFIAVSDFAKLYNERKL